MKYTMNNSALLRSALILGTSIALGACNLDLENPNAPTEEEVLASIDGVIGLAVGMQDQYASAVENFVVTGALITDEWATQSRALVSYRSLIDGVDFDNTYGVVSAPWSQAYRVIKSANTLLEVDTNTDLGLGDGMKAGLVSLAHLFRGMAYGQLALQYNQAPVDVSVEYPVPQPRATVLAEALSALEAARSRLAGVPDADLAGFRTRVIDSPAFDLKNTIDAMLARFYLADGQYANAIAAANRVDLSILSVFRYPSPDRNPIENLAFQALYVAALESFVTDAEAGDDRPAYWVDVGAGSFVGNPDSVMLPLLQYSGANDSYPIYLPDEMKLIKAEALTRTGDLAGAATLVNEVRTQNTSAVDEPVANLGALPGPALDTEAELIAQIAYERRYELFMQGLRWDDTRRLGVAVTTTPTMTFLPTPASECDSNPQSGC